MRIVIISILFLSVVCAARAVSIPADGGDIAAIVIKDASDPVQSYCAEDLQRIFKLITGKQIDIVAKAGAGRCLYIGCAPEASGLQAKLSALGEEGIYLSISPHAIICTGQTSRGVYYSVQELLYRLGYRMIWPGKYGECIPEGRRLRLPQSLELVHEPSFQLRGGHFYHAEVSIGRKPYHVPIESWVDWAARNHVNRFKGSGSQTWNYGVKRGHEWKEISGHTFQNLLFDEKLFKTHPEYFALCQGERVRLSPTKGWAQPCVSNPEVIEYVTKRTLEYFKLAPNAKRFALGQADGSGYCQCENCKALDADPPKDWSKHIELDGSNGSMTDRWLYMVNEVAKRVEKEFPEKWIVTFAYGETSRPPLKIKPRKNVMVESCCYDHCRKHKLFDETCPENHRLLTRLKGWKKASAAISIYAYLEYKHPEIPEPFFDNHEDFYKSLHKLGIKHIADEINTTPHSSPLLMGLWARLLWDINTNSEEYIDGFCTAAYGKAAEDMKKFWLLQQQAVRQSPTAHPTDRDIQRYTPEMVARSHTLLDRAMNRDITDEQQARVDRTRMSLYFAELHAALGGKDKDSAATRNQVSSLRKKILTIAGKYNFAINATALPAMGGEKTFCVE